ncbi:MAG TPA: YceI family protein [Gammaproteobacteria bacterium]|nr:YceI family protein [Gammaproteobacteria bacterium]
MNRIRYVKPLIAAATAMTLCVGAFAAEWNVVPESSSVGFIGAQQGTRFNGRFQIFTAQINFDPSDPASGTIVGTVQTESVNTRDHDRDAALLDKDWFNAKEFPEARFESQSIERAPDGSYQAAGQLTLKGQTKPAVLKFTFSPAEASAADPAGARFAGSMVVNRFDYNVGEGWNDTSWVAQDVTVEVKLDLKR